MANDMKSGVGFLIPAAGVVGFFAFLFIGEFLISIIIAVLGILIWFLYMLVMESHIPEEMGNMIILFGVLLSLGIFFGFGIKENMWGGFELQSEGSIFSLVILFFAILTGLNFRNQQTSLLPSGSTNNGLTNEDRDLVMDAIKKTQEANISSSQSEPKVIVVKQETDGHTKDKNQDNDKQVESPSEKQLNPYDPYNMATNPYFAYPPDYYYDDDDEDEDEYEDEDDWEYEDDWEDEDR